MHSANYIWLMNDFRLFFSMDEFYSHYYYDGDSVDPADGGVDVRTVSSHRVSLF